MRVKTQETQNPEPSTEIVETFETVEDKTRREYASAGADYAYFIVQFLQGRRRLEIQPSEIVKTQTYARSDEIEKKALRIICESDHEIPPSPEDELKLRTRDQLLLSYVEGRNLGHADSVQQLTSIPQKVAERQYFDSALFGGRVYTSPVIFRWVWRGNR